MLNCRQNGHCGSSKMYMVAPAEGRPSVSPCCGTPAKVEVASLPPVVPDVVFVVVTALPEPPPPANATTTTTTRIATPAAAASRRSRFRCIEDSMPDPAAEPLRGTPQKRETPVSP